MSDGISIIIPTLNRGAELSVSAARFADVLGPSDELIIIDQTDSPDADVRELYHRLLQDSRVHIYFCCLKSSGLARNIGAAMSGNDILLFWDDDLEPLPGVLEKHRAYHRLILESQQSGGRCGSSVSLPPLSRGRRFVGVAGCYEGHYVVHPKGKATAWNFAAGHVSLQKSAFMEAGGFNRNFVYPFIPEDYELHVRLKGRGCELIPALDCGGIHATVSGLSCDSIQSESWYSGVVFNHLYSFFNTLWIRSASPSGVLASAHLIYTLFRYMLPVKLLRLRPYRSLFWREMKRGWGAFRTAPQTQVEIPEGAVIPWLDRFPELEERACSQTDILHSDASV